MSYDQAPGAGRGPLEAPEALTTKYAKAGNGIPAESEERPIPPNAIFHGACGKWWTGSERSHCGGCHLTLSSLTAFERHRKGGRCNPPETVGLVAREKPYGPLWGLPGPVGGLRALHADEDDTDGEAAA